MRRCVLGFSTVWVASAVLLAACAGLPPARPGLSAATLSISLPAARRLFAVTPAAKWRLSLDGADLSAPFTRDLAPAPDGRLEAAGVPTGSRRVLDLEALDDGGTPIAGSGLAALVDLAAGNNLVTLDPATTVAGQVAARVLADDRKGGQHVLAKLDPAGLAGAIARYAAALGAAHPALLDVGAIASGIESNGGTPPDKALPAFARAPGRVVVQPSGWPDGLGLTARLNDPASTPIDMRDGRPAVIEAVPPGTWTLSFTAPAGRIAPKSQTVTVTAGKVATVEAALEAGATAGPALPLAAVAGASGVLTVAGAPQLVLLGGFEYEPGKDPVPHLQVDGSGGASWSKLAALGVPVADAASAVANGQLFYFGGLSAASVKYYGVADPTQAATTTCGLFDPAAGTISALPALPDGQGRVLAAACALDGAIYVAGGAVVLAAVPPSPVPGDSPPPSASPPAASADPTASPGASEAPPAPVSPTLVGSADLFAYDVASRAWKRDALPGMPFARAGMAGAAVGHRWYVFGGADVGAKQFVNGQLEAAVVPQREGLAWVPGAEPHWAGVAAMPTARMGAAAVVVDGKIWVIGGAGPRGVATGAVEVYDPATDTWSVRAPLAHPRSQPAVGLVGGKILVAGGVEAFPNILAQTFPYDPRPVADVEEITP